MSGSLGKGMLAVFSANVINLVFNLLTNFLLPKYLSVDAYAAVKTYQLYVTYVGVFALGFADGMYLRYGGKSLQNVDASGLKTSLTSFRTMMLAETVVLLPLAMLLRDKIIIGFVLSILSLNMTSYFRNLYQAVGEFKLYGRIQNYTTIAMFVVNMGLLFLLRVEDYFPYLIGYAVVNAAIWLALEWNARKLFRQAPGKASVSVSVLWQDIRSGFVLMVGNFSNILLSSMDRWFVKVMMDAAQFAYYSFAVSLEGFLHVAVTPITVTLYNYFCNHHEKQDVVLTRRYVLLFSSLMIACAYPAKFVVEVFLTQYMDAMGVMFVLFASQMVAVVIKGVYVNLYKATRQQHRYFLRLTMVLVIGAALNWLFVTVAHDKLAFSFATLASTVIWLALSVLDFRSYGFSLREAAYMTVSAAAFIVSGLLLPSVAGLAVYLCVLAALCFLTMRAEVLQAINAGKKLLTKRTFS